VDNGLREKGTSRGKLERKKWTENTRRERGVKMEIREAKVGGKR